MSRSRKKTPVSGWTGDNSEKEFKRLANRRLRRKSNEAVRMEDPDGLVLPNISEISSIYWWAKDGKFRFTPDEYPKLMRK